MRTIVVDINQTDQRCREAVQSNGKTIVSVVFGRKLRSPINMFWFASGRTRNLHNQYFAKIGRTFRDDPLGLPEEAKEFWVKRKCNPLKPQKSQDWPYNIINVGYTIRKELQAKIKVVHLDWCSLYRSFKEGQTENQTLPKGQF